MIETKGIGQMPQAGRGEGSTVERTGKWQGLVVPVPSGETAPVQGSDTSLSACRGVSGGPFTKTT